MESYHWKIIQFGVSILVGVASIWYRWHQYNQIKKKETDPKLDFLNFVFYKPLALAFLIYIAGVVSELKYVNFGDYLNSKPEISELSKNLNETYSKIGNNKILLSIVNDKIKDLNTFTQYATNNEKVLKIKKSDEILESAFKIFQNADNDSKIFATSYVNPDDWWYGKIADDYLQANYDFIKNKNGKITRIYLFQNQKEYDFFDKRMREQKANGIDVYYIFISDLPAGYNYNLKQDIIIVGSQFTGRLQLNDNRNIIEVGYYASSDIINENKTIFDKLSKMAKPFPKK